MPKAEVDPSELQAFATELKQFNSAVQEEVGVLRQKFARLGETWRDQERTRFAEAMEKSLAVYARLTESMGLHVPFLLRKAQRIQEYLGIQPGGGTGRDSAQISGAEVITDFRLAFMKFEEVCKQAVAEVRSDCGRVQEWLRHDQPQHWKEQLRKIEDTVRRARSDYDLARYGAEAYRKTSFIEEQKALQKAERRKEEIEQKIEATRKWGIVLEQQSKKLMGPINNLASLLESSAPVGRARLDRMAQCLEEYARESPADAGTP